MIMSMEDEATKFWIHQIKVAIGFGVLCSSSWFVWCVLAHGAGEGCHGGKTSSLSLSCYPYHNPVGEKGLSWWILWLIADLTWHFSSPTLHNSISHHTATKFSCRCNAGVGSQVKLCWGILSHPCLSFCFKCKLADSGQSKAFYIAGTTCDSSKWNSYISQANPSMTLHAEPEIKLFSLETVLNFSQLEAALSHRLLQGHIRFSSQEHVKEHNTVAFGDFF